MAGCKPISELDRFLSKVEKSPNGCWTWLAYKMPSGYGLFSSNGRNRLAHRISYRLFVGEMDRNLEVMHSCDNPSCVNPQHLSMGTRTQNMQDAKRKGRTARGEGHGRSKLSDADVVFIRESELDRSKIAALFGLSKGHVSDIRVRKRWAAGSKGVQN